MDIVRAPPEGYSLGYGNIVSVAEPIDCAKKNPGRLVMACAGSGTTGHLGGELFEAMTGTFILHVKGDETVAWGGAIGPANRPPEIVERLRAEIRKALASRAVIERYRQLDTDIDGGSPAAFRERVRRETIKWAEVVKRSGAKIH